MLYFFLGLFSLLIAAADQVTKYLTVAAIPLGGSKTVLPGIVGLTHVQNTGGAWSVFSDHTWLLIAVSLVFFAIMIHAVAKKWITGTGTLWSLFAVLGGGLGNLIDRVRLGYVVDMIETQFMDFPVFNVADCFITCGAIAMAVFLILDEKKNQSQREAAEE